MHRGVRRGRWSHALSSDPRGGQRRLGLFGGSFDPPHRGHLAVARAAARRFALDRLLLAPTGRQPLKPGGASAAFADRLEMVARLCALGRAEGLPLEASDVEAPHPDGSPNYTVDTLRVMQGECGSDAKCELYVVVGEDAFAALRQWHQPEELLRLAQWIVVSRPAAPHGESAGRPSWPTLLDGLALSSQQRARVHRLGDLHDTASATAVRQELAHTAMEGGVEPPVAGLTELPLSIEMYIRARHLYGT